MAKLNGNNPERQARQPERPWRASK